MANAIRIGILGLGRAGWGMHCAELKGKEKLFNIVAGCDSHAGHRQRMADAYPACQVYSRPEDLFADPNVELVSIATRSMDHVAQAVAALKTGKHVFLEKPISLDYAGAKKLEKAAATAKARLLIRHNRRFEPGFLHIREIIASGVLGDLFSIRLARTGYGRRNDWQTILKLGGGQLLNWGPHIIDHALQFLGAPKKPLKNIWGALYNAAAAGDAEDHVHICLTGHTGCVAEITISGGMALPLPVYHISGTRGSLTATEDSITLRYLDPKKKLESRKPITAVIDGFGTPETLKWIERTIPVKPKAVPDIWEALYRTIRENKPFPIKMAEAMEVMRVTSKVKAMNPSYLP